jgi:hypothetical protein
VASATLRKAPESFATSKASTTTTTFSSSPAAKSTSTTSFAAPLAIPQSRFAANKREMRRSRSVEALDVAKAAPAKPKETKKKDKAPKVKQRPKSAERTKPPSASTYQTPEALDAKLIKEEVKSASASGQYSARITGTKEQAEMMDKEDKTVTMYCIEVTKGGKTWTIYRRFNQFELVEKNIRHHGAWPKDKKLLPKAGKGAEKIPGLQSALNQYLSSAKVQDSNFMFAFIEPLQLGDIKK